ncbi:hypothetical protein [Methylomonas sp. LWB]|uniref:hypothetical protein n=1 Tax=Methylomonas sp. LWB TaxID=1905845 RepID=UPI00111546C9|nr:hypothetical protein [Methylomonas sp. LWB]
MFVPRSVYSDLADISEVTLYQKKKGQFVLSIVGGDASESYTVEITFNKNSLIQRALIGNETKQILQKTIYYPPPTMD